MKRNPVSYLLLFASLSLSSLYSHAQQNASALEIKIQELYVGILGRAADRPGQTYWRDQINSGFFTLENTRAAFTDSAQTEYTEIFGGLDFTQLVIAIYQNFLERDPDGPGLDYWVGELSSGRVNADQMINAVINAVREVEGRRRGASQQSLRDILVLNNKIQAAVYFTERTKDYTFDLSVREAARAAVADVNSDPNTVTTSYELTDAYIGQSGGTDPGGSDPGGSSSLMEKYQKSCHVCHSVGAGGAPQTGDAVAWQPRLEKGMDALVQSVENGLNAMPPKGMCFDCTAEDYRGLIEFMSTATIENNLKMIFTNSGAAD